MGVRHDYAGVNCESLAPYDPFCVSACNFDPLMRGIGVQN